MATAETITCPTCGKTLRVPPTSKDRTAPCPKCGEMLKIAAYSPLQTGSRRPDAGAAARQKNASPGAARSAVFDLMKVALILAALAVAATVVCVIVFRFVVLPGVKDQARKDSEITRELQGKSEKEINELRNRFPGSVETILSKLRKKLFELEKDEAILLADLRSRLSKEELKTLDEYEIIKNNPVLYWSKTSIVLAIYQSEQSQLATTMHLRACLSREDLHDLIKRYWKDSWTGEVFLNHVDSLATLNDTEFADVRSVIAAGSRPTTARTRVFVERITSGNLLK